jgi:hypothetical protein
VNPREAIPVQNREDEPLAPRLSPDEALARVFEIILEEIADKPAVKRRILDALGAAVVFSGEEAKRAIDPVLLALKGYETFRKTLMSFEANDTKKIVRHVLVDPAEMGAGVTLSEIVDLAWSRAEEKLDNVRARRRD